MARGVAESFGSDAERCDRARPSYPDALIEKVLAEAPGKTVLDVGVGTGIVGPAIPPARLHGPRC